MSLLIILLSSGCGEQGYDDLEAFIENPGEGLQEEIEALPAMRPLNGFVYQAFDLQDPFSNRAGRQDKTVRNERRPDLARPKEVLESYPLENLTMVGSLQRGRHVFGLIKTPDNSIYRVKRGNYVGENFGLIAEITEAEITLREIVRNGDHDWTERMSVLMLQTRERE
ncbi:pilus assembly protein PilP [Nitrosomonas sp. ANs5]|uniref:pilus assembly protein PilP n=1 Tax=Nitrosomonas sp. ANs5 TaxID=3423941 RepID=UPI003D353D23